MISVMMCVFTLPYILIKAIISYYYEFLFLSEILDLHKTWKAPPFQQQHFNISRHSFHYLQLMFDLSRQLLLFLIILKTWTFQSFHIICVEVQQLFYIARYSTTNLVINTLLLLAPSFATFATLLAQLKITANYSVSQEVKFRAIRPHNVLFLTYQITRRN